MIIPLRRAPMSSAGLAAGRSLRGCECRLACELRSGTECDNRFMTRAQILARLDAYERLIRLDKPIGTLLLLWPTLWALWIASSGRPRMEFVVIFAMGTL